MAKDISEIIGWKCPCGQTGNMGKFCISCGKVQPLVGAQRAVPDPIAATVEDKPASPVTQAPVEDTESKASDTEAVNTPVSAVSEYYDYSNEGSDREKAEADGKTEEVRYAEPQEKKSRGLSIAGMVTGIVSCALFFIPVIGVASGISGMIMTIKAKDRGLSNGFTSAGTICSAIGCAVGYLVLFRIFI